MSRNFGIPTWLTRRDDEMDDFPVPPIAALPAQNVEPPSIPESPEDEAMRKAAATMAKIKLERQQQLDENNRLAKENQNLRRENELLRLDVAQLQNNLATAQSQVETFRQEASDTRALFSSIRAQLDHFEIPLPVRKRVRNGKTNEASHALPEKPVDRPTIQPDQAA